MITYKETDTTKYQVYANTYFDNFGKKITFRLINVIDALENGEWKTILENPNFMTIHVTNREYVEASTGELIKDKININIISEVEPDISTIYEGYTYLNSVDNKIYTLVDDIFVQNTSETFAQNLSNVYKKQEDGTYIQVYVIPAYYYFIGMNAEQTGITEPSDSVFYKIAEIIENFISTNGYLDKYKG